MSKKNLVPVEFGGLPPSNHPVHRVPDGVTCELWEIELDAAAVKRLHRIARTTGETPEGALGRLVRQILFATRP